MWTTAKLSVLSARESCRRALSEPDAISREVMALVNTRFASHPGALDAFA